MKKIIPFLWFNDNAEEAAKFYVDLIPDAEIVGIQHYNKVSPDADAKVMTVSLRLADTTYTLLNGGPHYALNPAFSLLINCDSQEELDRIWNAFEKDGKPMQCGWISDKFGVTWQVVPKEMFSLLSLPDRDASQRVMSAMIEMTKIDLAALQAAAASA